MLTIYDRSKEGRHAYELPSCTVDDYNLDNDFLKGKKLPLPQVSEIDFVRHYTELSKHAFGVDNGFYPLGSCTMKYNPKLNEIMASLDGFTEIHPFQPIESVQGCLEIMYKLSKQLEAITGMKMSLQPAAGAHGEFTGLKVIKAYHEHNKDFKRTKIIVPDSAHGTNPASATLSGMEIINIKSDKDGGVDLDALKAAVGDDTAGLMLTNPNTLGKFDKNIEKIAEIVHDAGGLLYYDGANLNAVMGIVRPADTGFDVVHINIHKTFSTPHGGGGPGSGAMGVVERLADFLPSPIVICKNGKYKFDTPLYTIGKVKNFYGNFSVLVRAYAYIRVLGADGIKDAAQKAVLNANYLKNQLKDIDYKAGEGCMHEFVLSMEELHEKTGVSALDLAKAMIDRGIHPPTMYFPLIVHEALMFEPTETETKETLEETAENILELVKLCYTDPQYLKTAPHTTSIGRPDEVAAARNSILTIQK